MSEISFAEALNAAMRDSMRENPDVVVYGEDVGQLGGVFRVTDGLTAEFGEQRCFDTPIAESGIVGTAIGMAMHGARPVVEMQFDAFAYPAFEQVVSHAAKLRNRTRGSVTLPLVIRIPYGGAVGAVEHHSDSSEGYYAHTPGLTVVTPATVADAYSMLRASIAHPDPVVFLEPKRLYRSTATMSLPVTTEELDRAVVRREGRDVTLLCYGPTVDTALATADAAMADGYDVEVVDLRSLTPFDDATVTASVRKTGRAVVTHEAPSFAGYGAEVAARVTEHCFHYLEAPVLRVAGYDAPYPPPLLERYYLPTVDRLRTALSRLQWESQWTENDPSPLRVAAAAPHAANQDSGVVA
ncbi:alpha-ketoacid dehydrogenase subunit beta [Lipingzhangella sp. LS1_29]|uniref:3-methyl-2-oxobutanoate dehydrogenase (2-methylpropanoyl-transferring) n=1 Tax=Lipingzhangella rawalii TaxID=2055835 RepID=A0ABU2HCE7_9ACTN|nr:alpha-ketoacid dehydrogenase subunit beta [Lipingzhangella rawalii]MDS1272529.1 alpha-ketoacid dehydrogenase subunit beta [Lipingzhangella rawalii]